MTTVAIPEWNGQGIIPPIYSLDPASAERSPYQVALPDLVSRFGTTPERQALVRGLLRFRSALHEAGLTDGFQWVDGSFLEHIEQTEGRFPRDIDVVTFFRLPGNHTQQSLAEANPTLFQPLQTKTDFHVDAYFVHLSREAPEALVQKAIYWESMWSHRRDGTWKGFLQIDLAPTDEAVAKASLDALSQHGRQP